MLKGHLIRADGVLEANRFDEMSLRPKAAFALQQTVFSNNPTHERTSVGSQFPHSSLSALSIVSTARVYRF